MAVHDRWRLVEKLLERHGQVKAGELAEALGLSRQTAHALLARWVGAGRLVRAGRGRATHYLPAEAAAVRLSLRTAGLEEDRVWRQLARHPLLAGLSEHARAIAAYAFTEMLNNAIEHASARKVEVRLLPPAPLLGLEIQDDGVGVFRHLERRLALSGERQAIEELSKGKVTTDPAHHTGEGIFFTSKAVDVFELESSGLCWLVDNRVQDFTVRPGEITRGTRVGLRLDPGTPRRLPELFAAYTEDFAFVRTRIVVRLFEHGREFVSRSEARRLLQGLEKFREIVLDFRGVRGVGQGFADEVMRVWPEAHPASLVRTENMSPEVEFMIRRAQARRP